MQRFLLVVIAAVTLLVIVGVSAGWWPTQPSIVEPGKSTTGEVTTSKTTARHRRPATAS